MYTDEEWRAEWVRENERLDQEERERGMRTLKRKGGVLYVQEDVLPLLELLVFLLVFVTLIAGMGMTFGSLLMPEDIRYPIARWGMAVLVLGFIAGHILYHLKPFKVWRKLESANNTDHCPDRNGDDKFKPNEDLEFFSCK